MSILAVGVSHRRTPVEILERLAFTDEDLPKAYAHLTEMDGVRGAVILSTCNRVEVFAEVDQYHAGLQELKGFLAGSRGVPLEQFGPSLSSWYEDQAAEHLFSVAAGIDSMVLGEPQILSQVRDALKAARAEGAPGPLLDALFREAVRVGKRARAETRIGAGPAAFVEAGAVLAERALGKLSGRSLLVVGAGKMSELALRTLERRGVGPVAVLNRTPERAERLARSVGGTSGPLSRLEEAVATADLVVCSTGASGIVIDRDSVERALAHRGGRPLFFLDLAVPRDVDPAVADLPGVSLANIDHLKGLVAREDDGEVAAVRSIVAEEVARFAVHRRAARLAPLLQALYERGERVRQAELRRAGARLARLSEEERAAVDAVTRAVVKKLLHRPAVRAKEDDGTARALAELFGLEPPGAGS